MAYTDLSALRVGGVPVFGSGGAAASYFGRQWFVDTVNGSDGYDGTTPTSAFATMGRAFYTSGTTSNLQPNDTIWFVGKVREQLIAPLTVLDPATGTNVNVTGVQIIGMEQGNVRDDDGAKWYAPASPVAGQALLELRQQGWVLRNFLMSPDTTSGACVKAHRNEDATYPDSSHFICNNMRFVGTGGTTYGIQDVGGNHHYIVDSCEFQSLSIAIYCSSTSIAVPLRNTIMNSKFYLNTDDIQSSQSYGLVKGNSFFTPGSGTHDVVNVTFNASQGDHNMVELNFFNNPEAEIAPATGYDGSATDVWLNYVNDQAALAVGQPA